MRKSITGLVFAFSVFSAAGHANAQPAPPPSAQAPLAIQENAPDRYTVVKGDTLWGIASRFLKDPWRWPEIWKLNEQQIRDPHWIYPGNVIVLDRSTNPPQISVETGQAAASPQTVKLSPRVYSEPLRADAIPAIPPKAIEPFLAQPLVIEEGGLEKAPRIVATEDDHVYLGSGSKAYVSGLSGSTQKNWQIYRPGKALVDPDTGYTLGIEAEYLGTGQLTRGGDPAIMQIVTAKQEISIGDRVVAMSPPSAAQYLPHAPKTAIKARVVSLYNSLDGGEVGPKAIVAINRGRRDGLEDGHVLALYHAAGTTSQERNRSMYSGARPPEVVLPEERYGLVFVFRTFDSVSYALVMETTRPVSAGDRLQTP